VTFIDDPTPVQPVTLDEVPMQAQQGSTQPKYEGNFAACSINISTMEASFTQWKLKAITCQIEQQSSVKLSNVIFIYVARHVLVYLGVEEDGDI